MRGNIVPKHISWPQARIRPLSLMYTRMQIKTASQEKKRGHPLSLQTGQFASGASASSEKSSNSLTAARKRNRFLT